MQRKQQRDSFDADIAKGNEASALLGNTLLNETLDKLEKDATEKMINAMKAEEREKAWYSLHAIREFKAALQSLHISGRLAATRKNQSKGA